MDTKERQAWANKMLFCSDQTKADARSLLTQLLDYDGGDDDPATRDARIRYKLGVLTQNAQVRQHATVEWIKKHGQDAETEEFDRIIDDLFVHTATVIGLCELGAAFVHSEDFDIEEGDEDDGPRD